MEIKLNENDFYFCYDLRCSRYLSNKGIGFITVAKNKDNDKVFSMYLMDKKLMKALDEYEVVEADRLARIEFYEKGISRTLSNSKRELFTF